MGKNWHDPAEMAKDTTIYAKWVLVLAGVAAWDVLSTFPFDWMIISGKRKWRWPMALYFICRVCLILHIFSFAVELNAIAQIPCIQVVWIAKITDAIGTCCASFILLMRTVAVWQMQRKIWIPLGVLWLVQIALWCQTFRYSRTTWNPQRRVCQVLGTAPPPLIVAVFSWTMAFDFIVMCLCTWKLFYARNASGISSLIFRDGIGYFAAAFGANLVQAVLASLGLNPVMNIIALPFALVVSIIAATTVFRNVFSLYDDFSSNASRPTGGSQNASSTGARAPRSRGFSLNKSRAARNSFPMDPIKTPTAGLGGIQVTRVVDVERDAQSTVELPYGRSNPSVNQKSSRPEDDGSDSWTDPEERKSHLPL
ncbi:hypothetical protein FRB99_007949 [Tulasnella sp. 403]|nr:hypothetical protein FRB99_007949 [Tulasnella sp. 403]